MSRPHPSGRDGELCSRYLVTNVLLLLLVLTSTVAGSSDTKHKSSLPLQSSCDLQDHRFCWLPTNTTIKEVDKKDVQLVWKYNSSEPVDEILITRFYETDQQGEDVASWTLNGGSKTNSVLSTKVNLQHRTEGDVGIIILTLIYAYPIDFDKHYLCQVSIKKRTYSNRQQLKAINVDYRPVTEVVEGRPGEDVKFVWIYKYPLPVETLIFHTDTHPVKDMMTWTNQFEDVEDEYKNRLRLNMTSNLDEVEITLTVLNTTVEDYNHTYYSHVVAEGGDDALAHLFLSERRFRWLPTNSTVKDVYKNDVQLVWKYNSTEPVNNILITRSYVTFQQKQPIASLTTGKGSKYFNTTSTTVSLEHRKTGDENTIILTLINASYEDFDTRYHCRVYVKNYKYEETKELQAIKIEYRPVTGVVEGRRGEDVKLVWIYKYPRPVETLIFHTDTHPVKEMMTWTNRFADVEDEYKNRLRLDMRSKLDEVEITLTLFNTTVDDYDHTYYSHVVAGGGDDALTHLFLSDKGNKVDVDRKEKSPSSTASGVFNSNLWMCFILISFLFY